MNAAEFHDGSVVTHASVELSVPTVTYESHCNSGTAPNSVASGGVSLPKGLLWKKGPLGTTNTPLAVLAVTTVTRSSALSSCTNRRHTCNPLVVHVEMLCVCVTNGYDAG